MKIGEVAKRTGCNIETIRYYERIGVIDPPPRRGAYRDYGPCDTERLRFIRRARELGFSLEEVRALLDLTPGHEVRCDEVQSIAEQHLASVRAKQVRTRCFLRKPRVIAMVSAGAWLSG